MVSGPTRAQIGQALSEATERIVALSEQRDRLQHANTEAVERARVAEARSAPDWLAAAVARADAHGPFADLNHAYGVLAEEMHEFLEEVRRNHDARARLELIDIAAAAIKAVRQIDERNAARWEKL